MKSAKFLEVKANARYWEDSQVNGIDDEDGSLIPFRNGDSWCPVIDLESNKIVDWPAGTTADIHYKVCGDGEYWLLDENKVKIAKSNGYYVPGRLSDEALMSDYIIFSVGPDGALGGCNTELDPNQWHKLQPKD